MVYRKKEEFILYGKRNHGLLNDLTFLMTLCNYKIPQAHEDRQLYYDCIQGLVEFAVRYGISGNIYHAYLAHAIIIDENPFSLGCEMTSSVQGNLAELVKYDFEKWQLYYEYDLLALEQYFRVSFHPVLTKFDQGNCSESEYPEVVVQRIEKLAEDLANEKDLTKFMNYVIEFYKMYGVGAMGLHKAFRLEEQGNQSVLQPITKVENVLLSDLVGYEIPKKKLIENTEAFLAGKKANNCLLYGDAGTGKSSSMKGLLNAYYNQGLRMIEVYKHQYEEINEVIGKIRNRKYKYIIFLDDLSFEEFEVDYKYLKAVIEGGLEDKPDNVLIYATSNRRHLIQESFRDKELYKDQLHTSDTVQEKLSLAARFGVSIYFGAPDRREFQEIVKKLADRYGIYKEEQELLLEANQWEISHGGLSGRTAQQFINYLLGK